MKGKKSCDPLFLLAYLKAWDEMMLTGKTVRIEGYGDWKVSPVKRDDCDT